MIEPCLMNCCGFLLVRTAVSYISEQRRKLPLLVARLQ